MTNIWHIFDVMTNLMMRWQTFWRDDVLLTPWRTFWSNDKPFVLMTYFDIMTNILKSGQTDFLKSWRVYDIITNLWRHNKHNVSNIFDIMVNVLALWKFLMAWHTIWRHDTFFDVMTNFLTSWCVLLLQGECCVVMTYSMTCLYCPDKFVDAMTCFWCHSKFVDAMTCFWRHSITFWSMLHLLTSWRTFWCHGSFDDMTHFLCPDARHVFYIMTNLFVVMTYVRHYFGNKI